MNGISVVIPAFNAAVTLEETLESVMSQTRPPDQVIVVDDGSSDATSKIAGSIDGTTVLRQTNGGVASALNTGLLACRFSHVALLDADDIWLPTCLETHQKHLEALPGLDASVGWAGEFVCPALPPSEARKLRPRPAQPGWLYGATLQRRDVFERAGLFNPLLRFGAWIDWVDRARHVGVVFGVIEQLVLKRRLHPDSLSVHPGTAEERRQGLLSVARLALARRRPVGP